jgi:hypothetical protein
MSLREGRCGRTAAWAPRLVAYGLIFVFAMIRIGLIFSNSGADTTIRVLAVVGILDAAWRSGLVSQLELQRTALCRRGTAAAGAAQGDEPINQASTGTS